MQKRAIHIILTLTELIVSLWTLVSLSSNELERDNWIGQSLLVLRFHNLWFWIINIYCWVTVSILVIFIQCQRAKKWKSQILESRWEHGYKLVPFLHLWMGKMSLKEGHDLPSVSVTEPGWGGSRQSPGLTSRPPAAASSLRTAAEPLLGTLSAFSFSNTELSWVSPTYLSNHCFWAPFPASEPVAWEWKRKEQLWSLSLRR